MVDYVVVKDIDSTGRSGSMAIKLTKEQADQKVIELGGDAFAHITPENTYQAYWVCDPVAKTIVDNKAIKQADDTKLEILRLEALETPRRLAEAILSDEGKTWLQTSRDAIATERDKL